jgi:hypothetical protein
MKKGKTSHKETHAPRSQVGTGDYYGSGIRQKVGRVRNSYMVPKESNEKLNKPPKSLA